MKKLNQPINGAGADGIAVMLLLAKRSLLAINRTVGDRALFLLLTLLLLLLSPAAFAQSVPTINTGKNGSGTTLTPDPNASAAGIRGATGNKGYLQRNPYANLAFQSDTQSKSSLGPQQSNPGSSQQWMAYAPVVKMCDVGYGIAYLQIPMLASATTKTARDNELFSNQMTTYGLPMSDSQYQIISRENNQRLLELAFDPERIMWMTSATSQTSAGAVSNSMATSGELALMAVFNRIINADGNGALINVANEGSVAGLTYLGNGSYADVAQAVSMVQVMYKLVFVPMAVLFLLPGAVVSQAKAMASKGFGLQGPEQQSPFDGILRSIVAVFLIPSTQVIVSWAIDTGNSLAYSCRDWVDLPTIMNWSQQLAYNPQVNVNAMTAPNPNGASSNSSSSSTSGLSSALSSLGSSIGGSVGGFLTAIAGLVSSLGGYAGIGDGLAANQPEAQSVQQQQDWMGQALQSTLNGAMLMAALTLIIMGALQLVTICYLLLLGPISAAFYAWPQVSSTHLFRGVFGKWVDGVIKVSLWRFFWMAILAIMTQRIIYMGGMPTDLKWEAAVFICFLGLMVGVPAQPFNFAPYSAFVNARQLQSQSAYSGTAVMGNGGSQGGGSPSPGQATTAGPPSTAGGGTPSGAPGQQGSSGSSGQGQSGTQNSSTGAPSGTNSPDGQPVAPAGQGNPPSSQTGGAPSAPAGVPAAPSGGQPGGGLPPASGLGESAVGGGGSGGTGGGVGGATGGGTGGGSGGPSPGGQPNVSVNAQMPANAPATPLMPTPGTGGGKSAAIANPSAAPAAPSAPAGASAAGGDAGGGDGGGDSGGGSGAKAAKGTQVAAAGGAAGAPDAGGAIGQIASATGGISPPPPSSGKDEVG